MKKSLITLTIMLAATAMIVAFSCSAQAAVTGPCVNCHTMHNSQGGTVMAMGTTYGEPGYGSLTLNTCLGCHTTTSVDPLDGGYPRVQLGAGLGSDTNCLAGGFFTDQADPNLHGNDHGDMTHTIGSTVQPAGYNNSYEGLGDWYQGDDDLNGLRCAGSAGCHGNEIEMDEAKAIAGGHHANDLKGTFGYRMLAVGNNKIKGTGASDFEKELNASPSEGDPHNYYSANDQSVVDSISDLCGKCHGNFHTEVGSAATAWTRHPTDVTLPAGWEIPTDKVTHYTADDWKNNPVGTVNAVDPETATDLYVTCLSCHRAHGSANDDILRWPYSTQSAGGGNDYGCLGCHDRQR